MSLSAYRQLQQRFARLGRLRDAQGILHWDRSVMMPAGGADGRAEQLATLDVICHEMIADPEVGDLLAAAEGETLTDWERANLREMRRGWIHASAVDAALVEAKSRACSACEMAWREARPLADFEMVLPFLEEVLRLTIEVGKAKAVRFETSAYDALLDEYEPAARAADIDPVFDDYAGFLPDFLDQVLARQAREPAVIESRGPFPVERQRELGLRVMQILGFDFHHGRLDVSLHPFTGGASGDQRITTRYSEEDFSSSLMGTIHETGHALYEQHLPRAWRHQPVGGARGMVVHESQSLLMEMQVARSREFLSFAAPVMREAFGAQAEDRAWQPDNLLRLYTRVSRSFIRTEADEVTYPAHVILRYRLERSLIAGDLRLRDLPGAWNDAMKTLLGVVPPDDRLGCLQDIHWYDGAFGYFPTYTLGAMAAAQLFDAARKSIPGLATAMSGGEFKPLVDWLCENVHGKASYLSTRELLAAATGRPLDPAVFKAHLKARYLH
ncbi:MAG: carboxypeptidase M32 [Burkholderiales bacterium]|nr:carboxypeptidase M32 [Burkholderiales bacterium]